MTDEQWIRRNASQWVKHPAGMSGSDRPYVKFKDDKGFMHSVYIPSWFTSKGDWSQNPEFFKWFDKYKELWNRQYNPSEYGTGYTGIDALRDDAFKRVRDTYDSVVDKVDDYFYDLNGKTTTVPLSNSGDGVLSGTSDAASPFDSYLTYLNYLKEINESNNAFNVEQAQKQMDFQAEQNKIFMDFNALEAQKSRDWQTEMSNTAYQRQVADMQAAGLNPVLAASGGNGASIGSGTAAAASGSTSGSKASADNLYGSAMLSMMNNAFDLAQKAADSAVSANYVAAKNVNSNSGVNLRNLIKDASTFVSLIRGIKGLFS